MGWAHDDMVQGYMDGLDLQSPDPSSNRTRSYRHGFANGRDDRAKKPRDSFTNLMQMADECIASDESGSLTP